MGVAGGVISAGVGVLFFWVGLEDADRWASVFGVFLNVAGVGVAVYSAVWTRRAVAGSVSSVGGEVANTIRGGRFAGPVVQARDVDAGVGAGSGMVSNRIEDGQFHSLVIQGRDVRGVDRPAAGQAGDRPGQHKE